MPAAASPWFVYLLLCHDGSYYAGISTDVQARFAAHVAGKGARYTRSHRPQQVLAQRRFADRPAALRAEYALKQLPKARKLAWFAQPPADARPAGRDVAGPAPARPPATAGQRPVLPRAAGQAHRQQVLGLLLEHGELPLARLRAQLPCSAATLSRCLSRLCGDGLVARRRQGQAVHYRILPPAPART